MVSRSSSEAEYKALANQAAEVIWVEVVLQELDGLQPHPPVLWCHNLGVMYLTTNPVFDACIKHVKIDFHLHERVAGGALLGSSIYIFKGELPSPLVSSIHESNIVTKHAHKKRLDILKSTSVPPTSPTGGILESAEDQLADIFT